MKKLLIRTWFGPLPDWTYRWIQHHSALRDYGWDFWLIDDYDFFKRRCEETIGIRIAPYEKIAGTRKAGDFDPAYGDIFADELRGYDFWGHCALDAVYGRLDRYLPDEKLAQLDVFANDPGAICGPFSVYRNCAKVNALYATVPGWVGLLSDATMYGFDEIQFNRVVQEAAFSGRIRFETAFWQSHDCQSAHVPVPKMTLKPDGSLIDRTTNSETMMFHFHRYRQWPIDASC